MTLFTLADIVLRSFLKFSLLSEIIPRSFCDQLSWTRLLLKATLGK